MNFINSLQKSSVSCASLRLRSLAVSLTVCASLLVGSYTQAQKIIFDLTSLTDNVESSAITADDGLTTLTVSTTFDWDSADPSINVDSSGGLTVYQDPGSAGTAANLTFTFSKAVTLDSFVIGYSVIISNDDYIDFTVGSETKTLALQQEADSTELNFPSTFDNWVIPANTALTLTNRGSGITTFQRWSNLTVTVVPEPATYALLLGCGVLGVRLLIRRRAKNTD